MQTYFTFVIFTFLYSFFIEFNSSFYRLAKCHCGVLHLVAASFRCYLWSLC